MPGSTTALLRVRLLELCSRLQRKGRPSGAQGASRPWCTRPWNARSIVRRTSGGQIGSTSRLADRGATCQSSMTSDPRMARTDGGRWALRQRSLAQTSRSPWLRLPRKRVTLLVLLQVTLLLRFTRRRQLSAPRSATPARLQRGMPRKRSADHIVITLVLLSSKISEQLALNSAPEDTYVTG